MGMYASKDEFEAALRANVRGAPITLPTGETVTLEKAIQTLYAVEAENQRRVTRAAAAQPSVAVVMQAAADGAAKTLDARITKADVTLVASPATAQEG